MRVQTVKARERRLLGGGGGDLPAGTAPRAICVLLNGHTEFLEKYGEVAQELNARGFSVGSMDWRGQGASERKVYGNRAGHVGSFEEYDSDLASLLLQMVEPMQRALPERVPVIALAHSMGAHILFRFLHDHPRRFACAVALAPMLEIDPGKRSPGQIRALTLLLNLSRPSTRSVLASGASSTLSWTRIWSASGARVNRRSESPALPRGFAHRRPRSHCPRRRQGPRSNR